MLTKKAYVYDFFSTEDAEKFFKAADKHPKIFSVQYSLHRNETNFTRVIVTGSDSESYNVSLKRDLDKLSKKYGGILHL